MSNDELHHLNVSAQDVLAAIAFEAQKIVASAAQHAAGYPFPSPMQLQQVIDRMVVLNKILLPFDGLLSKDGSPSMNTQSAMKVELN